MSQTETSRSTADENFKAAFGHYPIRVELPEPTPDPQLDALVARWFGRGQPPKRRGIDGGRRP
jgi:hypothetical protein